MRRLIILLFLSSLLNIGCATKTKKLYCQGQIMEEGMIYLGCVDAIDHSGYERY